METPQDSAVLKDMGFENTTPKGNHYVCGYLTDLEFAYYVQAVMNAPMPEGTKKKILGTLNSQSFPTL